MLQRINRISDTELHIVPGKTIWQAIFPAYLAFVLITLVGVVCMVVLLMADKDNFEMLTVKILLFVFAYAIFYLIIIGKPYDFLLNMRTRKIILTNETFTINGKVYPCRPPMYISITGSDYAGPPTYHASITYSTKNFPWIKAVRLLAAQNKDHIRVYGKELADFFKVGIKDITYNALEKRP